MKKAACSLLAALVLAFMLPLSVPAAEAAPKVWRVTASAHVLSNRGGDLVVYLTTPDRLRIETIDTVHAVQVLPLAADALWLDKDGNPIDSIDVQPGQKVRVTFRYTMRQLDPEQSYRYAAPLSCTQVQLKEGFNARKSSVQPWDLPADETVGVVMNANETQAYIYAECGYTAYGRSVYTTSGGQVLEVKPGTKIYDADGSPATTAALKPFQRVRVKMGSAEFYDGSPGFEWYEAKSIRILGEGEQLLPPAALARFSRVACTVLESQSGEDGEIRLLVRPDSGTPEAEWQPEYLVTHTNSFYAAEHYEVYKPGDRVLVEYRGIRWDGESPGRLLCDTGRVQPADETAGEVVVN